MFNLLQLFIKLSSFFVFVLLEIICFSLVVKYNQTQKTVYATSVNRFTGYLQTKSSALNRYLSLSEENEKLDEKNAQLLTLLTNIGVDTARLLNEPPSQFVPLIANDTTMADSLKPKLYYKFIEAMVVKNSINSQHNYFVLNKGAVDGVREHSGVLSGEGVVGVVRKVSHSYAVVMSILHRQTRISARLRSKNYFGSVVWKSDDMHTFNLEDIPKDKIVSKGDTVETSGYSDIFPKGIMLGVVEKAWIEPGSNFYTIEFSSKIDMSNLQHAYIVLNLNKDELERLEQAVLKEDE